jgi:hypothetical protein
VSKLSFYEQVGIVIPGALFLAVIVFIAPGARAAIGPSDISLGEFGVFVLVSYAAGHALAAIGNGLESAWWSLRGGMPSDWVVYDDSRILDSAQKQLLLEKLGTRFRLTLTKVVGMKRRDWRPVFRQIYVGTLVDNPGRIETFNGIYGLHRGLLSASVVLVVASILLAPRNWLLAAAFGTAAVIYGFRMNKFAIHYAREVYLCFLNAVSK